MKCGVGSLTKEEWLANRDLSLMCGPRQLLDKDGNRVYLGIAAREIGINPARDMGNREAAKANTSEFNRGRAEANAAIQDRVAPKGRSVSDVATPVAAPPANSKTGVFTGENVINNDF